MFPPSRTGWRLLNLGMIALAVVLFGGMVVADPSSVTVFIAVMGLGMTALLMVLGRAERDDEELAERERARLVG